MDMFSLAGKVAVLTGASKGIGRGLAAVLADAGASVALVARSLAPLEEAAAAIEKRGGKARCYACDLRVVADIGPMFEKIAADFGHVDVLVNNAGMGQPRPALEITEADWDTMMSLNLKSVFFCSQAAARFMVPRRWGRIVTMSSQAGFVAIANESVYCASKGGVNQLTKALALELAPHGIIVNAVAPGWVDTDMAATGIGGMARAMGVPPEEARRRAERAVPAGRFFQPEEIALGVAWMLNPGNTMQIGQCLNLDGGVVQV